MKQPKKNVKRSMKVEEKIAVERVSGKANTTQEKTEPEIVSQNLVPNTQAMSETIVKPKRKTNWGARLFWSMFFIFAGILLLLNNFGVLSWSAWLNLFQFWPVLLILIGIEIVFGKSLLGKIVVTVITFITFAMIAFSVLLSSEGSLHDKLVSVLPSSIVSIFDRKSEQAKKTVNETKTGAYSDVKTRELNIDISAGELNLNDDNSNSLLSGEILYDSARETPRVTTEKAGDKVLLSVDMDSKFPSWNIFSGLKREFNLSIGAPDVVTDLSLHISAGSANVDLNKVAIKNMSIDQSAGASVTRFSNNALPIGTLEYNISAGSAKIYVPTGVIVNAKYNVSAGSVTILGKSLQGNGTYKSDLLSWGKSVDLVLDVSAGSVEIINN